MSISYNRLLVDIKYFITQTVKFWVFMIRCTQYEKHIPAPKDRFAFLFALSQKKDWHDKSTIYRDGCIQHTELCVKIPLITTFSPSSLIALTVSEMY